MTTIKYLVRASLLLGLPSSLPGPNKLPICLGSLKLDKTPAPNDVFYLDVLGVAEPEWFTGEKLNSDFPLSLLYIDSNIKVYKGDNPTKRADETLEQLESLIRLFQPGEVSVRRHRLWQIDEDRLRRHIYLGSWLLYDFKPLRPPSEGLHERPEYPIDDDRLDRLVEFINMHWYSLEEIPDSLRIAIARFNSSYEKYELSDRLIDLVIALEALFGDGERDSTTYKVAIRCASWLNQPGSDRCATFEFVKKMYSARSNVVHGDDKDLCEVHVNDLEGIVRESLKKFLDHQLRENEVPKGKSLDVLILTGRL